MTKRIWLYIEAHINHMKHIRRTQLLFTTGIERGIHDRQVLKYQPLVTSRLIFQYSIIQMESNDQNITLDVSDGT